MNQLVTALSIETPVDTALGDPLAPFPTLDLLAPPTRKVTRFDGAAGIRVREVVVPRVGRRGSRNRTRFRDDATITLEGILQGADAAATWAEYDRLATAFTAAVDTDRTLLWTAGNRDLQQKVRLTSMDQPIEVGPDILRYQVQLRASDPNAYSQVQKMLITTPLPAAGGGGFTFPRTFPIQFQPPLTVALGVVNEGNAKTPPVLGLLGYLVDPIITLQETGEQLVFSGTLAAGDYLVVDVDARTITLNGTADRRNLLVSEQSTWFELPAGVTSTLLLSATDHGAGAYLSASWRDAYE